MARAESYALENCQNGTIAGLMGWDREWLHGREDILTKLRVKRQEHKLQIRQEQRKQLKNPVMAIWLGKNALGQTDRVETQLGVTQNLADLAALFTVQQALEAPQGVKQVESTVSTPLPVIEAQEAIDV